MNIRNRSGFALITAVAALAFIEVVVIGLVALTARTRTSAEEHAAQSAARIAAESAIRIAIAHWDELAIAFAQPGTRFTVPWATGSMADGTRFAVEAERLRRGQLLLRGIATRGPGAAGIRAAALATVSSIPSGEPRADFHSALVSGGDITLLAGAVVDGSSPTPPPPPLQPGDCVEPGPPPAMPAGAQRPGVSMSASAALNAAAGSSVSGAPAILGNAPRSSPSSFMHYGRLAFPDLAAIADHIATGAISLAPRTAGAACDTLAWGNWGAPANRTHPCFDWLPFVFAPGDLTIAGGQGQGILVVDGDLTIAAGVEFRGAVLVSGRLDAGAATITGAIRVGGTGSRSEAAIRFDECTLGRAFTRTRAMRKVYRVANRWWLPAW